MVIHSLTYCFRFTSLASFSEILGQLKLVYALGEQFVPGSDRNHFCKPTGVVTTPDGNVFIADGYCNSRIVRFNANGEYISEWGQDFDGWFISKKYSINTL